LAQYDQATADSAKAIELDPSSIIHWRFRAHLFLYAGKTDEYRRTCADLLERFGQTKVGWHALLVVRACSVGPDAIADPTRLVPLAELFLADGPQVPWHLHFNALAHHRAGQHDAAIRRFQESLDVKPEWVSVLNWLGLALAHHSLGQTAAAREWFTKADEWLHTHTEQFSKSPSGTSAPYGEHWLEIQLLHREAKRLIFE
jgi:tetratricopeptide (TPR) repeat protein